PETLTIPFTAFSKGSALSTDASGELVGVGYIIGFRTSAVMMAGAVMGYLILAPTINIFGGDVPRPEFGKSLSEMHAGALERNFLRSSGAGAVAAAGIISMCKTLPMIVRTMFSGVGSLKVGAEGPSVVKRTSRDMPMWLVVLGAVGLLGLLSAWLS